MSLIIRKLHITTQSTRKDRSCAMMEKIEQPGRAVEELIDSEEYSAWHKQKQITLFMANIILFCSQIRHQLYVYLKYNQR